MEKGKIVLRLVMVIFLMFFPLYKLYTMGTEYLSINQDRRNKKNELSVKLRKSFPVRNNDFYEDKAYNVEFKKLRRK